MAINWIGTTQNAPNISTAEGPAYVDANGNYWRTSTSNALSGSTANANGTTSYSPTNTGPTSSSSIQTTDPNIQAQLDKLTQLIAASSKPTALPMKGITIDPSLLSIPTISEFEKKVDPNLLKYYDQLLEQSNRDVTEATRRMKYDYDTGNRRLTEDITKGKTQAQEDLASSLAQLGITFPKEQEATLDTLNKRGIALTQEPGQPLKYAGSGRAGYEVSQLSKDQALRKEAVERNASRTLGELSLKQERGSQDTAETATRAGYDIEKQKVKDTADITNQKAQARLQRAQLLQSEAQAKASGALQEASLKAQGASVPEYKSILAGTA